MCKRFKLSPNLPALPQSVQQKIWEYKQQLEYNDKLALELRQAVEARDKRREAAREKKQSHSQSCVKCFSPFRLLQHCWPCTEHVSHKYPNGGLKYYPRMQWPTVHLHRQHVYTCGFCNITRHHSPKRVCECRLLPQEQELRRKRQRNIVVQGRRR